MHIWISKWDCNIEPRKKKNNIYGVHKHDVNNFTYLAGEHANDIIYGVLNVIIYGAHI